jgi:hypothetical protein
MENGKAAVLPTLEPSDDEESKRRFSEAMERRSIRLQRREMIQVCSSGR